MLRILVVGNGELIEEVVLEASSEESKVVDEDSSLVDDGDSDVLELDSLVLKSDSDVGKDDSIVEPVLKVVVDASMTVEVNVEKTKGALVSEGKIAFVFVVSVLIVVVLVVGVLIVSVLISPEDDSAAAVESLVLDCGSSVLVEAARDSVVESGSRTVVVELKESELLVSSMRCVEVDESIDPGEDILDVEVSMSVVDPGASLDGLDSVVDEASGEELSLFELLRSTVVLVVSLEGSDSIVGKDLRSEEALSD